MYMSENINELAMALSKAQGQIKPAIKDKKNPHFKSSYADLASTWEACRSALSENGKHHPMCRHGRRHCRPANAC